MQCSLHKKKIRYRQRYLAFITVCVKIIDDQEPNTNKHNLNSPQYKSYNNLATLYMKAYAS